MLYVVVILIFGLCFLCIYSLLSFITKDQLLIKKRIGKMSELDLPITEMIEDKSFLERIALPSYKKVSQLIARVTPSKKMERLRKRLDKAGKVKSNPESWLFKKVAIIAIITIVSCLLMRLAALEATSIIIFAVIGILFLNTLFQFNLSKQIETRKKRIQKDLPYILDLIMVSVEAGLSFDGAIARVVNSFESDLCTEFAKCLKEMRMGIQKKLALKSMGDRCEVRELSLLITSIIQADELGVSLGNVLRIESSNLRDHRRQVIREKAMKVPVKMLLPLIIFIFPSVFIIILGPAVIQIFEVFMK